MTTLDLLIFGGFGVLALAVYGSAFALRVMAWRRYRDQRARRTLLAAAAFLVVAVIGVSSIGLSVAGGPIELRRVLGGLAWGAFAGAGVAFLDASRGILPGRRRAR